MTNAADPRPADAIDAGQLSRVLVIMLRHHGDVLLTTPVIETLKRLAPQAEVDALVYAETRPMLEFNPQLSQLMLIDRNWKKQGLMAQAGAEWALLSRLRARRYDLVVHLTGHRRGAWLVRALRPRWSVAPRPRSAQRFWTGSFTHTYANASSVAPGSALARRHTVEQNLDALRRLGLQPGTAPALTLVPGSDGEAQANTFLKAHDADGDFIVVQPTSRWMFKTWPVAKNAALLNALLAAGHRVVLSCAPDAREQAMIEAILALLVDASGKLPANLLLANEGGTLNRLAALIGRARLFVGIDSAPMHIAAAMGTPVVALFGPSGEFNWGPWRGDGALVAQVVTSDHSCRPCGQDGCGGGKVSDCLTQLPVSQVMAAIEAVMQQSAPLRDA